MTIREELRACAATRRVDLERLSGSAFLVSCHAFAQLTEDCQKMSIEHRATFLLLVAEAL